MCSELNKDQLQDEDEFHGFMDIWLPSLTLTETLCLTCWKFLRMSSFQSLMSKREGHNNSWLNSSFLTDSVKSFVKQTKN